MEALKCFLLPNANYVYTVGGLSDTIQQSKPTTEFEYGDEPNRHIFNVRHEKPCLYTGKRIRANQFNNQDRVGSQVANVMQQHPNG